jgi:hypothetical protein
MHASGLPSKSATRFCAFALEQSEQISEPLGELLKLRARQSELCVAHLELLDQRLGRRRRLGAQIERARGQGLNTLRKLAYLRAKALRSLAGDCQQAGRVGLRSSDHRESSRLGRRQVRTKCSSNCKAEPHTPMQGPRRLDAGALSRADVSQDRTVETVAPQSRRNDTGLSSRCGSHG